MFSPLTSIANLLVRNPMAPVRIEAIDCEVEIEPGRKIAVIESVRLLSDTIEPGKELKAFVTLKPYKGDRETVEMLMAIPDDFPEGGARALYRKRPVLLFDEATSALDTESESVVKRNIDRLLEGRTAFVVAHRLSTIRDADLIVVLERGRLVEQGSHDELLDRKGVYFYLYTQQLSTT